MSNGEDPAAFEDSLDDVAEALEDAETEDDLDGVEASLDDIEGDLEEATFEGETAEDDEDGDDDEDDEASLREDLEAQLGELREDLDEQRGPYVTDVTDDLSGSVGTIRSSEWTEEGESDVAAAVEAFFATASDAVDESFALDASAADGIATALESCTETLEDSDLDPDEDAEAIASLLEAAETLEGDLDDAQVFDDLEVREQLRRLGFYDVLDPEAKRDFPPEWNAVKIYQARNEVEPLLTALEKLDSDFMESNILDALEHMGHPESYDDVHALAKRRNKQPVRILGKIGDERACDTLEDFLGGGDVKLEQESLRALGAIGNDESTEAVAQRLAAEKAMVRSEAARALGLLGDPRAIDPLADVLAEDESESVRASAAWALNSIGTREALDIVAEHADDRSYLVQVEAEKAAKA